MTRLMRKTDHMGINILQTLLCSSIIAGLSAHLPEMVSVAEMKPCVNLESLCADDPAGIPSEGGLVQSCKHIDKKPIRGTRRKSGLGFGTFMSFAFGQRALAMEGGWQKAHENEQQPYLKTWRSISTKRYRGFQRIILYATEKQKCLYKITLVKKVVQNSMQTDHKQLLEIIANDCRHWYDMELVCTFKSSDLIRYECSDTDFEILLELYKATNGEYTIEFSVSNKHVCSYESAPSESIGGKDSRQEALDAVVDVDL